MKWLIAVSYTHLDVYKRQAFLRGSSSRWKREKGLQQRLHPFFFRSHAAIILSLIHIFRHLTA